MNIYKVLPNPTHTSQELGPHHGLGRRWRTPPLAVAIRRDARGLAVHHASPAGTCAAAWDDAASASTSCSRSGATSVLFFFFFFFFFFSPFA